MKNKVIVFAVHPDDETLGAGATLAKHQQNGDEVHWVILTSMGQEIGFTIEQMEKRKEEIKKVAGIYNFSSTTHFPYLATRLDQYPLGEIASKISEVITKIAPDIVYIPFSHDVHSDHQIAFNALRGLSKSFRYPFIKKILCMEVLSETNYGHLEAKTTFLPNYFIDVTGFFEKKLEALNVFQSEIKPHPFARSLKNIEALAVLRGSEINKEYAEAFQVLKMIE